jgi:predicted dehydrogenase
MAVVDDMAPAEKVRLYDKGAEVAQSQFTGYAEAISVRSGDIVIPRIEADEPLRLECEEFIACVREHRPPRTDGRNGLAVVRLLDAARRSLDAGGARVAV